MSSNVVHEVLNRGTFPDLKHLEGADTNVGWTFTSGGGVLGFADADQIRAHLPTPQVCTFREPFVSVPEPTVSR